VVVVSELLEDVSVVVLVAVSVVVTGVVVTTSLVVTGGDVAGATAGWMTGGADVRGAVVRDTARDVVRRGVTRGAGWRAWVAGAATVSTVVASAVVGGAGAPVYDGPATHSLRSGVGFAVGPEASTGSSAIVVSLPFAAAGITTRPSHAAENVTARASSASRGFRHPASSSHCSGPASAPRRDRPPRRAGGLFVTCASRGPRNVDGTVLTLSLSRAFVRRGRPPSRTSSRRVATQRHRRAALRAEPTVPSSRGATP
jgi:hypothetical protein